MCLRQCVNVREQACMPAPFHIHTEHCVRVALKIPDLTLILYTFRKVIQYPSICALRENFSVATCTFLNRCLFCDATCWGH